MQRTQSSEIDIAAIHDVNSPCLWRDQVQREGIAHFSVGNMDKIWNLASQIKQRVHFNRCLRRTKIRPWKQRKTQIDSRAVERINSIGKFKSNILPRIKLPGAPD